MRYKVKNTSNNGTKKRQPTICSGTYLKLMTYSIYLEGKPGHVNEHRGPYTLRLVLSGSNSWTKSIAGNDFAVPVYLL